MDSNIALRRAYDPPGAEDGARVLVDRLWPRGIAKADLALHSWMKDLSPSTELRRWSHHDPEKWPEFRHRYFAELDAMPERVAELRALCRAGKVTLIYAARDAERNNAVALRDYLLMGQG